MELFQAAKKLGFAIPAVNVTSSSTANACMEAAASLGSPIILQVMICFRGWFALSKQPFIDFTAVFLLLI